MELDDKKCGLVAEIEVTVECTGIDTADGCKQTYFRSGSYMFSDIIDYSEPNDLRKWVDSCKQKAATKRVNDISKSVRYKDVAQEDIFVSYKLLQKI